MSQLPHLPQKHMWFYMLILSTLYTMSRLYGSGREKTCPLGVVNNTGADQPAHPHSLISTFVICCLKSIIHKLASG